MHTTDFGTLRERRSEQTSVKCLPCLHAGSAAAQVAEAFGKRATFHRTPSKRPPPATSGSLPLTPGPQTGPAAMPAASVHSAGLSKMRASPAAPGLGSATRTQPPSGQPAEGGVSLERQASAAPAPGAAAAEVRRAFSQIMSSSGSSSADAPSGKPGRSAHGSLGAISDASGQTAGADTADAAVGPSPVDASVQPKEQQQSAVGNMQGDHAGGAISKAHELTCEAVSESHHLSDQQASRSRPSDQKTDVSSTAEVKAAQGQHMGRAMSLKGAAAADTALAFSRLRSRAGSLPVEQQPTHSLTSKSDEPTAAAAVAVGPPPHSALQQQQQQLFRLTNRTPNLSNERHPADPRSAHAASQPCARPVPTSQERTLTTEEQEDSQAQAAHAAGMGRPVHPQNSGQVSASSEPTSSRHSAGGSQPQLQHGDGMLASGFGMEGRAIDIWDAGSVPQRSGSPAERAHAEEAENTVELAQARADRKVPSPRPKRASLGRRLSGMLPGVKGKERAKVPSASKEVCVLL